MSLLVCLALLLLAPAVASLEQRGLACAHSIEHLCQDLNLAVKCGVVNDCAETEWSKPKVDDNICDMCKKFIGQIDDMLKDKTVQDALRNALHKGCHLIPVKEFADQCDRYIDSYLSIIFALLEKEMKPDVVCAALGLCKHWLVPLSDAIPVVRESLQYNASVEQKLDRLPKDPFTCNFCRLVMKKLKVSLPEEQAQNIVVPSPSKICSELPNPYFAQCHSLMEQKGHFASDLLFKRLTTKAVCDKLQLCSSSKRDSVLPIMDCAMCDSIMQQLQSARKQSVGVDVLLSEACNPFSDVSKLLCEDFLRSNELIFSSLVQNQEERDLCGELGVCAREVEGQLLGSDECSWGPSHWCSDWETAVKCQAVTYCTKNGWI